MSRLFPVLGHAGFAILLLIGTAWAVTALWVQLGGWLRLAAITGLLALAVGSLAVRLHTPMAAWLMLAVGAIIVGVWYQSIRPSENRDWAFDVAHGVKARVEGDLVTLSDIRDFRWDGTDKAEERWITRQFDLADLESLDMLTSVWSSPNIAHLLVSFGFRGGEKVTFSAEIRREKGEAFSEIGGFFRQFELVLIAATENDIVRLRTNERKEEVRLYPITLNAEQRRRLFLSYVALAQELEAAPRFYNTVTANCTTVVLGVTRALKQDMPLDWRLLLSGHLPAYIDGLGVLGGTGTLAERSEAARITPRAQAYPGTGDFSAWIRSGG